VLQTYEHIFICYSHQDRKWLNKLQTTLYVLEVQELFTIWDDTQLTPGTKRQEEIRNALSSTKIAILPSGDEVL